MCTLPHLPPLPQPETFPVLASILRMPTGKLHIVPLGGMGEFGMNCMAIRYGDDIIVVDAGPVSYTHLGKSAGKSDDWNLSLYTPVIVKYRDEKTDRGIELEEWLR